MTKTMIDNYWFRYFMYSIVLIATGIYYSANGNIISFLYIGFMLIIAEMNYLYDCLKEEINKK